jgi:hypothetical protein
MAIASSTVNDRRVYRSGQRVPEASERHKNRRLNPASSLFRGSRVGRRENGEASVVTPDDMVAIAEP